ncbi:MAG: S1 RNA-binding domain-containing protein [Vicinamibacterales bacterium]
MSEPEEDFATLFEASLKAKPVERGQTIEGTIVAIGHDVAFVDVGSKGEAVVDLGELKDPDGVLEVKVGDRIQAVVVSTTGGLTLSRRLVRGAATDQHVIDAYESGLPVEGKVERVLKGGYEVRIGRQRAFCPFSQIDTARTTDPEQHVGRVYTFRIIEFKDEGRNLVVSRRALLEEEQEARAEEVRRTIVPGAVLKGRVASVRDFGAFVDLGGGIQGLLHVSEMGWTRAANAADVVTPGEEITVKVLRVDEATHKVSLGMKQLLEDPWTRVPVTYAVGQVHTGRVTRLAEFGAFVELEPGIEGLAHASTFPPTGLPGGWAKSIPVGLTAPFEILSIDTERKRIGISMVPEGSARTAGQPSPASEIVAGARLIGKVDRIERFGVFVFLAPGRVGLIPFAETGVERDADVAKAFPIGADVEVIVLELDASGRRIRLSRKAVLAAQEQQELRDYVERADGPAAGGLGSLAEKLRGALKARPS